MSPEILQFLINNLFLPPKLPGCDEDDVGAAATFELVLRIACRFASHCEGTHKQFWTTLAANIKIWSEVYDGGIPCETKIAHYISGMRPNDVLLFHIASQNAALLLRQVSNGTIFECYEISPKTENVIAAQHALKRSFPAQSVLVRPQTMQDAKFIASLSSAIQNLSIEQVAIAMEQSSKSGHSLSEERQSVHPKLVSEWLFGILAVEGSQISAKTICKRTHDDVCFADAARPWRRSPVWLSLRIALQLCLANSPVADQVHSHYKNFMLYLLSAVTHDMVEAKPGPDTLHVMRIKLARRAAKLSKSTMSFVQESTFVALETSGELLAREWQELQSADAVKLPFFSIEQPALGLTLHKSASKLKQVCQRFRQPFKYPSMAFNPSRSTRCVLVEEHLPQPAIFRNVVDDGFIVLTSFETWVANHLFIWLQNQSRKAADCTTIKDLIQAYYSFASTKYQGNAERSSIMFLVIFELWVALDRIAIKLIPLLREYTPEIPETLLTPLLLPNRRELDRLYAFETYLHERHLDSIGKRSIFDQIGSTSFSVRYFDHCAKLQHLRSKIEEDAQKARDEKLKEWEAKKAVYDNLVESMKDTKCDLFLLEYGHRAGQSVHSKFCRKHEMIKQASALSIEKHEWPLPSEEDACKAAVFELNPPKALLEWRDTTWTLLHDVGRRNLKSKTLLKMFLLSYGPLERYHRHTRRRIVLASETKSFLQAHYFESRLSLDDVLVSHGSQYRLYDGSTSTLCTPCPPEQKDQPCLRSSCVSNLPVGPYKVLNDHVNFTRHSQNEVLASQSQCPPELSIHEWVSFGDIRADEKLQWQKFLRELLSSNINFNATPVLILLQQLGWQAGSSSPNTALRAAHADFADSGFCRTFLEVLEKCFASIKANWKEMTAASGLLLIVHRLLSLSEDEAVTSASLKLIRMIRKTAMIWLAQTASELGERSRSGKACEKGSEERRRVLEAALLVRSTWNVDEQYQHSLFGGSEDVADYVESSIYVHDYKFQFEDTKDPKLRGDLCRDRILAIFLEKHIQEFLRRDNEALGKGIQRFWDVSGFANAWAAVLGADQSWLTNETENKDRKVHYNVITGELLVGGKALTNLPKEYTGSALYQTIFGRSVLEVFPADVNDMEYMTVQPISGHTVYFGMRDNELVIRSKMGGFHFEAIAREWFCGDFPIQIVKDTTPWMRLNDGRVEFRGKETPWHADEETWVLFFNELQPLTSTMRQKTRQHTRCLVDLSSAAGHTVTQIFQNFERPEYLLVSWTDNVRLEVSLTRYRLNFFKSWTGQLECQELSAQIDQDQRLGTLHGFQSRLVLRSSSDDLKRIVLIPYGKLLIASAYPHVTVNIDTGTELTLSFFQYKIDIRLGQLQAEGNLEAHLYKAYLHAVTSSVRSDSLTGRTGTEESILCLSDSITKTTVPLSTRAQDILRKIALLTPVRTYYPAHLKKMQKVSWNNVLSPLTQHDCFVLRAVEISEHNREANFLYEGAATSVPTYQGDLSLLRRAQIRHSKLYARQTADGPQLLMRDDVYASRDREQSESQKRAFEIATLIKLWPTKLPVQKQLYATFKTWRTIGGFDTSYTKSTFSQLLAFNIQDSWASMYNSCRSSTQQTTTFELVFKFSAITFAHPELISHLRTLLAFAFHSPLRALDAPAHPSYNLSEGDAPNQTTISTIISSCVKEFTPPFDENWDTENDSDGVESDSDDDWEEERNKFNQEVKAQVALIKAALKNSWPAPQPRLPAASRLTHVNVPPLVNLLNARFAAWHKNWTFKRQCEAFEVMLATVNTAWYPPQLPEIGLKSNTSQVRQQAQFHFTMLDIMSQLSSITTADLDSMSSGLDGALKDRLPLFLETTDRSRRGQHSCEELHRLLDDFKQDTDTSVSAYALSLSDSADAWSEKIAANPQEYKLPLRSVLEDHCIVLRKKVELMVAQISEILRPRNPGNMALQKAGLWPQVNTFALLELLSTRYWCYVPRGWVAILIQFGRELVALQRVERMMRYSKSGDNFALRREIENEAHDAWDVSAHPEWLLLEVQNDLLIRSVQVRVAERMMQPENGVLLLGMGEGKTSVILPMVITALADGEHFLRVVVLKPLANEMLRALSNSLAGLVGRTVHHLPFSRKTLLDSTTPARLIRLYEKCRNSKGVLLTLPEHLNSFRLIGNDKLSSADSSLAVELLRIQKWTDCNARDIFDESDELLKPSYELVYANGEPKILSGAPDRWCLTQEVLSSVYRHASKVYEAFPQGIEYEPKGPGAFPHIRVLDEAGARRLMAKVTQDISTGKIAGMSLGHCNSAVLKAVIEVVGKLDVSPTALSIVAKHFEGSPQLDSLFLLRGLIASKVVYFALHKRWLVDYGLDRSRCRSAVPYRAKSVPSLSAEFAQPETMIVLTALSYYYTGITIDDMCQCIIILLKTPDPADEYAKWVALTNMPPQYRSVSAINLEDATCVDELYGHLQYGKGLIDFFLRHAVYPREAKEFSHKLSSSAWDLCSADEPKITTGFSGTSDSLLPLSIPQTDLPDLRHERAMVLTALMKPENRGYVCAESADHQRLSAIELLKRVAFVGSKGASDTDPSVIIDVGAQFLESNVDIAKKWLELRRDKKAVVFFDDNDVKMVINRDGSSDTWTSSPLQEKPNDCLIYCDEAHTRGTDFRLPDHFKAAVLLGPGLQKDPCVQACMRMRKLGYTQSVVFVAPPEVDNSIRTLLNLNSNHQIGSLEVIKWTIHQSCLAIQSQRSLWILRGLTHSRRRIASKAHVGHDGQVRNTGAYLSKIREQESQPVSEMYKVLHKGQKILPYELTIKERQDSIVEKLLLEWHQTDAEAIQDCGKLEEQEREVLHEVEQEREVQRPRAVTAFTGVINQQLIQIINTGVHSADIGGVSNAFSILEKTSVRRGFVLQHWPINLWMTEDFSRTIQSTGNSSVDDFLRPVNWVLKLNCDSRFFLISPYEANAYKSYLESSQNAVLYAHAPRTTKAMASFDALDVYRVPALGSGLGTSSAARTSLRLFSGQLYFNNFREYECFCELLGLWDGERVLVENFREVASDGFVSPACRLVNGWISEFVTSPVQVVKTFIGMRRKGIEWSHTHVGRVLNGSVLSREEFE